jgi:Uracil DNA glycosylase superfamily
MLKKLEGYYKQNGILATDFFCKHKSECSNGCENFTGPKSAFVSSGYEKGSLPRLLFLSLDSGSGDKIDENRLPYAVRKQEEELRDVFALPKHKHWFRTHELAWYIFKKFNKSLKIEEAKGYFSHANSAKCCMNNSQRKKADKILFKNCQKYLKKELEILEPKIIVTQGNEAKDAVLKILESRIKIDDFASIININNRETFWLHTYHPNNWGAFNKHRHLNKETGIAEGWELYAEHIYKFIS